MADSPFLPNSYRQYAWDSTSLGAFKTCPRNYYYMMIQGWRLKGEAIDLDFGIWIHKAIEHYEKRKAEGADHTTNLRETLREVLHWTWLVVGQEEDGKLRFGPWSPDHQYKNRYTLIRSVVWYLDRFGTSDPFRTVQLESGKPAVELSFRFEIGDGLLLSGHLDRVVELDDNFFVMDHKTTKSTITPDYFRNYSPDTQVSLYTLASQVIYKTPVKGVVIDAIQVAVNFTRVERGFVYRTGDQLEEWLYDAKLWIEDAWRCADNGHKVASWRMNDKACRFCAYKQVCSRDPAVRENVLETHYERRYWNPLEVR